MPWTNLRTINRWSPTIQDSWTSLLSTSLPLSWILRKILSKPTKKSQLNICSLIHSPRHPQPPVSRIRLYSGSKSSRRTCRQVPSWLRCPPPRSLFRNSSHPAFLQKSKTKYWSTANGWSESTIWSVWGNCFWTNSKRSYSQLKRQKEYSRTCSNSICWCKAEKHSVKCKISTSRCSKWSRPFTKVRRQPCNPRKFWQLSLMCLRCTWETLSRIPQTWIGELPTEAILKIAAKWCLETPPRTCKTWGK